MEIEVKEVGRVITEYFTSPKINQVAYKSGFVQRSQAKLNGLLFLQAFVFASLEYVSLSLSKVVQSCADIGLNISEQGLDERINQRSVAFMEQMFAEAMQLMVNKQALMVSLLAQFSAVNLIDSSGIPLPASMATMYPASRNLQAANLKLRLVFDFLYSRLQQVLFVAGRQADQGFSSYLTIIQANSLNIMDLGHFNLTNFKEIASKDAFYLSRYHHGSKVLNLQGMELDLLQQLSNQPDPVVELEVLVSRAHRLPCRLVAFRLKQEVVDQRRRKAKEAAKRRGKTLSSTVSALLAWSIYLTNAPAERLTPPQIAVLYRLRWQIELLFKLIKSHFGLRRFAQLRPERILTELYAKLIAVVLFLFILAPVRLPFAHQPQREISPVKVRRICQRFARTISQQIGHRDMLHDTLHLLIHNILTFAFKQKRIKNPNICYSLILASAFFQLPSETEQSSLDFYLLDFAHIALSPT